MKFNKSSKFGVVAAVGVLILCLLGAFLYVSDWDRGASDPQVSRYEWLLDPIAERFPPADQALELPGFRVAGVHYWQGRWNFNFWIS